MVRDGKGWYMAIQGSTPDNHHLLNFYIGPLIFERFLCSFGGGFRWWTTCGGLYWNAVPDDRIRCAKTDWLVETGRCLCQSLAERDHSGFYIPKWFDQSKQMQDMDFTKETEMDLINDDPQNWCFDFWLTSRQVCDAQWHSHWCLCSSIAMHPMHCLVTFNHPEQLEYCNAEFHANQQCLEAFGFETILLWMFIHKNNGEIKKMFPPSPPT